MDKKINIKILTDQIGVHHEFKAAPQRIVSLVPSLSELLCDLGLMESIVGVTKFCVHPATLRKTKTVIGGTKKINNAKLVALRPDLVIANKEENTPEIVHSAGRLCRVWCTDIKSVKDLLQTVYDFGEIFNIRDNAAEMATEIDRSAADFDQAADIPAAYLIWKDPFMVAGAGTYIDAMLRLNGFRNVFSDIERYPEVTLEEILARQPELIFLSSEPYPFREKHVKEVNDTFPNSKIMLVDGEMFSWYGSRFIKAAQYFLELRLEIK